MGLITEIFYWTLLFPSITYIKINQISITDIVSNLPYVLKEITGANNSNLRSLCFRFQYADEYFIQALKEIISGENLMFNYSIKRELDNVYIEWK